ncbi:MAG TPA: glycosyltransferase [Thermoguttaceae bacterium]|nr:glycosyltransferase [Thermoguttaceae bacterium]
MEQTANRLTSPRFDRRDTDFLRSCAWDIGERRPADAFSPTESHVGLAMVSPCRGFAHWRILNDWIDRTAAGCGDGWNQCRMVLRLYDVSYIEFDGLNAHRILDQEIGSTCGQAFFNLPSSGTCQLAEVGFLLRNGRFIPAARSRVVAFPPDAPSSHHDQTALLVDEAGEIEQIDNLWDQERILIERRTPKLRKRLRVAAFAFPVSHNEGGEPSADFYEDGLPSKFIVEWAAGLCEQGHEVRVVVPASYSLRTAREIRGVHYEPLDVRLKGSPLEMARTFGHVAQRHCEQFSQFDLIHLHEWMTGWVRVADDIPTVLSLTSIESTRCNGASPDSMSRKIRAAEREIAARVDCILTPDWLRSKTLGEFRLEAGRVHAFSMEGRLPNEWDCPLDYGDVKREIHVGPMDRLLMFVGPLEHAAGVDLILEAMPIVLPRYGNLRVAFAGGGEMHGYLAHRAEQLGVAHAVRLLGSVDTPQVIRLLRAADALVLPSRYRVPQDDAVVDMAQRAGTAVVTTHGGPAHAVRHEETGLLTYDNPGSIVWAMNRILDDPFHARRMGGNGRRSDGFVVTWSEVARSYLELCATQFPQLTENSG